MNLFFFVLFFILGTAIGSFLNSIVYRLEKKKSLLSGRSFCPKCYHKLGFFDLVPLLSFVFLKGRCRYCKKKISWQYPLVEISTGMIFLSIFNFQFSIFNEFSIFQFLNLIYLLINTSLLIIIFVYDLKHYLIPDKIIYAAIAVSLIFNFQFSIFNQSSIFKISIISAFGAAGFFFLVWVLSKGRWMGFGDVKLAFFIGLFLGYPAVLTALFSAFFIGAIIGLGLVIFGKKKFKSQIPFGPFLVAGTFIALFWGNEIILWYLSLL